MRVSRVWVISAGRRQPSVRKRTFLGGIAILTAGMIGAASPTEAATSIFWQDYYESDLPPPRAAPRRIRKTIKHLAPKTEEITTDTRKPQGPLIITISIEKQSLKVYDANGFFAEAPISTGTRDHPTPMGVFSVIQKHKLHHSNIYSDAPMPYMQRITWSGIAMHAGVLPGYPASHGCIRMPTAFAVKMWNWTRMGARVVITPGEMTPSGFSHSVLIAQKQAPVPVAAAEPQTGLELRSTVGHDPAKPAAGAIPAAAKSLEQTRTADASGAISPAKVSDATSSANETKSAETGTTETKVTPSEASDTDAKTRLPDADKAAPPKPDTSVLPAPKRSGQIAVFVSRKDGKLYVRQNFAPLFDVPVMIAPSDRPLGTHVFTAQLDKDDSNTLRWSVISLPMRVVEQRNDDERASRRRNTTGAVEVKPVPIPNTAAEALDRLTIPADAMARIAETLSTGGSIIVSDQGINTGETGEGTDFIIPLR